MRNECNIIRDILPLYADKMVSADTESFVEEHLIGCAECRAAFASPSNSVESCPDCRMRITRRQAAERMRKRRARGTQ